MGSKWFGTPTRRSSGWIQRSGVASRSTAQWDPDDEWKVSDTRHISLYFDTGAV